MASGQGLSHAGSLSPHPFLGTAEDPDTQLEATCGYTQEQELSHHLAGL